MVYTAAHRSLSILEVLVHIKGGAGMGRTAISAPFYMYAVSFGAALLEKSPISSLPLGMEFRTAHGCQPESRRCLGVGCKKRHIGCAQRHCS